MGRWLVKGGVKERGGSEMINNGTYLGGNVRWGMVFGVRSLWMLCLDAFLLVCWSKALDAIVGEIPLLMRCKLVLEFFNVLNGGVRPS